MAPPQIRDGMNARIPVKFMLTFSLTPCGDIGKNFFRQAPVGSGKLNSYGRILEKLLKQETA